MKTINLNSLISIYNANGKIKLDECIQKYLGEDYGIEIKDNELDLLRISESIVLNIEYKREISDINKVKNQAIKNSYYLKFLNKKVYTYIYIKKENKLYKLDENGNLIDISFSELINIMKNQIIDEGNSIFEGNLNELFEPANYLISPFNRTEEFLNNTYFLTPEQDQTEKDILNKINYAKYFLIEGNAGSGKTLLIYHIAKKLIGDGLKVGIIHCGKLNDGHKKLIEAGWNIKWAKDWYLFFEFNNIPNILIIDEIQRMYKKQLTDLITQYVNKENTKLILCGDEKQILGNWEGKYKDVLNEQNIKPEYYQLTSKIRTNKDIANFIKIMLDYSKKKTLKVSNKNINIIYFDKLEEASEYIKNRTDYKYISYTPSQYYLNPYADFALHNPQNIGTAHEVIGQEFKNVIILMNELFFYNGNILKAAKMSGIPYITLKMFFQQITRAINKIEVVVVKNISLYNKLIEILD